MKILVATDLAHMREKVACACAAVEGLSAEYISDRRALERRVQTDGRTIDLVLIDTTMSSFASAKDIVSVMSRLQGPKVAILLTDDSAEGTARRYVVNGANGVFPHGIEAKTLGHSLCALNGQHAIWLGNWQPNEPLPTEREKRLSDRELQVLSGICHGLQNKEIAHGFEIQEVTVKMHVRAIIRKLGAKNRTHAAMIARDYGLVD